MIDFAAVLLSLFLSVLGGMFGVLFGVWFTKKYMFNAQNIMEMADSVLEYATQTKEGQEKLNILGKWVVSNLMQNVSGSFKQSMPKPKDLFGLIMYGLAQRYLPNVFGGNQPQQPQEQSNPQPQLDNQSKW